MCGNHDNARRPSHHHNIEITSAIMPIPFFMRSGVARSTNVGRENRLPHRRKRYLALTHFKQRVVSKMNFHAPIMT